MDKQTVAVAVVTDSGIIESIRVSADYNKLRNTVLEEMAKEFSYELTGNKAVDYRCPSRHSSNTDNRLISICVPSMMLKHLVDTLLWNAFRSRTLISVSRKKTEQP